MSVVFRLCPNSDYAIDLPDGSQPIFTTTIESIDKYIREITEWKTVGKTITQNWWGTSEKIQQEPIHKEVVDRLYVHCIFTPEMDDYIKKSIIPTLKDQEKSNLYRDTIKIKITIEGNFDELLKLQKGQTIEVSPIIRLFDKELLICWCLTKS